MMTDASLSLLLSLSHCEKYRRDNKWPVGLWDIENDRIEYFHTLFGVALLALRNPQMGNFCGYIGIPPGHRCHGLGYDADLLKEVDVHGGLTYAGAGHSAIKFKSKELNGYWWLGFDCCHYMDIAPYLLGLKMSMEHLSGEMDVYRDQAYVMTQLFNLAGQLYQLGFEGVKE